MALIYCTECGKQISDSAKQCPHCGCPTHFGQKVAQVKGISVAALIGFIAAIVGAILFLSGFFSMMEGIDDYGKFARWLSRDDEAWGTFLKFCAGLGMMIGGVLTARKVKLEAKLLNSEVPTPRIPDELFDGTEEEASFDVEPAQKVPNSWRCACGRVNAVYVSTCVCGKNKRDQ